MSGCAVERKGPELVRGASYETTGGLIFLVLSPAMMALGVNGRHWRVLTLSGRYGGPTDGKVFDLNEDSAYHQNAVRL